MSIKLLVVDDAPFIREIVRQVVSTLGKSKKILVIGEAIDGEQAIEMSLKEKPDVILMDIVMPKVSGIEATKRILEDWPAAKILACSTLDQPLMVKKAMDAGCVQYITKPFEGPDLIKKIIEVANSTY